MVGVFINYRTVDQPLGAAAIHDALARRFGADQVFRDCVSMQAGDHYPTALREALEGADVLIAVIGRRWLTVTDQSTGSRLIDRPMDWVRREIARAFERRIPVIPVLLRDAHGYIAPPAPDQLPPDVVQLALTQASEVSHSRFGEDVDRLVVRLVQLAPCLVGTRAGHRGGDGAAMPTPAVVATAAAPQQLPMPPRLFTGRVDELAELDKVLSDDTGPPDSAAIATIGGAGGVGKTWLALQWAHRNADRFPDGQLYVNLRGFDPSGDPMNAAEAVRGFLEALGVEASSIPVDRDAQTAMYRSLVAGKRVMVVVDNAWDSSQVEPLLPGGSSCVVVVTSRWHLGGLIARHGARSFDLDVLGPAEARNLLTRHLGVERVAAEPAAAAELLEVCAGLPLAISVVAARADAHPDFPLAILAEELREAAGRLDGLDAGGLNASVRTVFSWSYQALSEDAAGVFSLLGQALAWVPELSLAAAANLVALPEPTARATLRQLETTYLVQQHVPGRYRMHDLIRRYAAEQAEADHAAPQRLAALRRLVDFYLHTACIGDRLLGPRRVSIELEPPTPGCTPWSLEDPMAALDWFDTEHACLLAAQRMAVAHGWDRLVWQLAWGLRIFHGRRGHLYDEEAMSTDNVAVWQAALAAARRLGEPTTQAWAHRYLGRACARMRRHAEALEHLLDALLLAEQTGDVVIQAHTQYALARAWAEQGDDEHALAHGTQALNLFRRLDNSAWEAKALNAIGWFNIRLGNYQEGRACCDQALVLFARHPGYHEEADSLDGLGFLSHLVGNHAEAVSYYRQALTLCRDLGATYGEANVLDHLGDAYAALNRPDQAREIWLRALALYRKQHRTAEASDLGRRLAGLDTPDE